MKKQILKRIILGSTMAIVPAVIASSITLTSCSEESKTTNIKSAYDSLEKNDAQKYYYQYNATFFEDAVDQEYVHQSDKDTEFVQTIDSGVAAPIVLSDTNLYNQNDANTSKFKNQIIGFPYLAKDESDPRANTYINFFINKQVAQYFAQDKNIYTEKVTKEALQSFINDNPYYSGIINLKGLLKFDNQRDNSIRALLNPVF